MNFYNFNDVNFWLRWMVKVCSMEENFVFIVYIGFFYFDFIVGYKFFYYSIVGY